VRQAGHAGAHERHGREFVALARARDLKLTWISTSWRMVLSGRTARSTVPPS
jgi:hypothetical protein